MSREESGLFNGPNTLSSVLIEQFRSTYVRF